MAPGVAATASAAVLTNAGGRNDEFDILIKLRGFFPRPRPFMTHPASQSASQPARLHSGEIVASPPQCDSVKILELQPQRALVGERCRLDH